MIARGRMVQAVSAYPRRTGVSSVEAKATIDSFQPGPRQPMGLPRDSHIGQRNAPMTTNRIPPSRHRCNITFTLS